MTLIDWTLVDEPTLILSLEREAGHQWVAVAQDGDTVYARGELFPVVRWMHKFSVTEAHVAIDEGSVERAYVQVASEAAAWARAYASDPHSRRVDNVVQLRKETA